MLRDATVRFEVRRYDDPLVAGLIEILQADFVARYGGPDAAVVDPDEFAPPRGLFLVLFAGDEPVAMSIREDDAPITRDLARFLPHAIM